MKSNLNIKVNGKNYSQEEVLQNINKFSVLFKDLDKNNNTDIVDLLNKKGFGGKIMGNIVNSYLQTKSVGGDTVVTVINKKINEVETQLKAPETPLTIETKPIYSALPTKKIEKEENVTSVPINLPTNPLNNLMAYIVIALVGTILYFVLKSYFLL